jgi:hypothetical protein
MQPQKHVNLYLDPAAQGQLRDLCQRLELAPTSLIYHLIDIAHRKLRASLRAKPLQPEHRLRLNSKLEFEQVGPLPRNRHEARRRMRYYYGGQLLDEFTQGQLTLLSNRANKPNHELLADLVDWASGQAGMATWDSTHNRPAAEPDDTERAGGTE